jgi:3-phosphoshikimate 1-carboxyvinyltransferase
VIVDGRRLPLVVRPGPPLAGVVTPPGDKSITHRAYLLALLAPGETRVEGFNVGADCAATRAACEALGMEVGERDGLVRLVRGDRLVAPVTTVDCGNSGTTMRVLPGILAAQPFETILDGDDSLRRRPVHRVVAPLRAMGARLSARDGDRFPPLRVSGQALHGIAVRLEVASAQVASAIQLAATFATGETVVEIPGAARDHTERMLPAFGVPVEVEAMRDGGRRVRVGAGAGRGTRTIRVPGDVSAAAFFLAAAAATPGASVRAVGVSLNPTRTGLLDVLERMGARVERGPATISAGEPFGDVTVTGPERLRAVDVPVEWVPRMIDEVPAWAVAACAADGVSRLSSAAELRVKESDRLAALAGGLAALGVRADESPDGLAVAGGPVAGGTVASAGDHRIAMAFAVLGTRARAPVTVDDARAIPTSYPGFVADLVALGGDAKLVTAEGSG